jgi:hypothetical protein
MPAKPPEPVGPNRGSGTEDKKSEPLGFKELLVVVPVIGSSLAITHDVGFFYGLDIGYFTFFSIAEHVVFALQAIPFVLVMCI